MFGLSRKRKSVPTGCDCGQAWVKVVGLHKGKQGVELHRAGRMPWFGRDRDKPERLAAALATLYTHLELKASVVITSLAGHSVIIKRLSLSPSQAEELPDSLHTLATKHIPFDVQDVCLDYQILSPGPGTGTQTVLLVASKKQMIHETQALLTQAGLETSVIDVDGFALCNCFEFNYPEVQEETVALLDIGASQSTFCVLNGHHPLFVRDAGFGGQQLTDRLVQVLDLSYREAETLKWRDPLSLQGDARTGVDHESQAQFMSWTEEVQRLLHYYSNSLAQAPHPQRLYLSGGGSLQPGLDTALQETLNLEVTFLDPWRQCRIDDALFDPGYLKSIGPQFAVAMGLALRGVLC